MLERKLMYTGLTVAALTAPACTSVERNRPEQQKEIGSFFTDMAILDERDGDEFKEQEVRYRYKNGIEAVVMYKTNKAGVMDIYIQVVSDPNNILVQDTPAKRTPRDPTYQMMIDGDKIKKAISFVNGRSRVRIVINGPDAHVKVDDKDWYIPPPLDQIGAKILEKIEGDLDIQAHKRKLQSMQPISEETSSRVHQY